MTRNCTCNLPRAAELEDWMRRHYHSSRIDIGSSGVEEYSFEEVRKLARIEQGELDSIVLRDGYSLGTEKLRHAIVERYPGMSTTRTMVTHGSSEAIYLIMRTLLRPGDQVVAVRPVYQQLVGVAAAMSCHVTHWSLADGRDFGVHLERLRKAVGKRTRMVVVNFPHNPTGCTLTPDEQLEVIRICERAGAYLVWDAAFRELALDAPPLAEPTARYERAIALGTLSKAFGLPGLRVGWLLADERILAKLVELRDYITLHLSPLVEFVAERVLRHADRFLLPRQQQARRNRAIVSAWLRRSNEGAWSEPQGGVCGLVRLEGVLDTNQFCQKLAVERGVMLVPGSCFDEPRYVRLGFGGSESKLRFGIEQVSQTLRAVRASPPPRSATPGES